MISPATVTLTKGEKQTFTTDGSQLEISPSIGSLNDKTYTAPDRILFDRKVTVRATHPTNPDAGGEAVIELSSNTFWVPAIAWYFGFLLIAVFIAITRTWPDGGITCETSVNACAMTVNPPAVTLRTGQALRFYATLGSRTTENATWTASPAGSITAAGDFLAPAVEKEPIQVKVTAKHAETGKTGEATVVVRKDGSLVLSRSMSTLRAGEELELSASGADTVTWMDVSGSDGSLSEKKEVSVRYRAPEQVPQPHTVVITAHNPAIGFASMRAFLEPPAKGNDGRPLFWLALLFGLLGGVVGSSRSFVNFVGSRKFCGTWGLFYLSRPGFAASLALLVHAAHRGGFLGSGSDNPYIVAFYAGLVGLFSDTVLEKMRQAVDYLLVFRDSRPDKMPGSPPAPAPPVPPPAAGFTGTIVKTTVAGGKVVIEGSGFVEKTVAEIDSKQVPITSFSPTRIEVKLDPAVHVAGGRGTLVLIDPKGGRSAPSPLAFI